MNLSEELLREYKEAYQIPPLLLRGLMHRDALPLWATQTRAQPVDWIESLHRAVTEKEWPEELREARAGLLDRGCNLGAAEIGERAKAIVMPVCTPAYLRSLLEIIALPMVFPDSPDPEAKMLYDEDKLTDSVNRLAHLSGMMDETGYADASDEYWGGAVTAATRFLYYHELGHLNEALVQNRQLPDWIVPGEEYLVEELVADQFALSMLVMELRRHTELHPVGFVGVALAFSLLALKEFSERVYEGGKRRTKNATLRMHRMLYWGALAVVADGTTKEAVLLGKSFWECFAALLRKVDLIPSPIFSLLLQTADRPSRDWKIASDHILRWCVFGDRAKVLSIVRKIRDNAEKASGAQVRARKVLDVIEFLLRDTANLEPTLGMRAALGR